MDSSTIRNGQQHRVAIIGAGVAGCSTAAALQARGIEVVVFEKQSGLGGLWYDNYPDASVQTSAELYEIPGHKYPDEIRNRAKPPRAAEVCEYLQDYVKARNLEDVFRCNTTVINIEKQEENQWIVHFKSPNGQETKETYTFVVLCSGLMSSKANIPEYKGSQAFIKSGGKIMHTSEWKSMDQLEGKRIAVVGNSKSAADAAAISAKVAKKAGSPPPLQLVRKTLFYFPRYTLGFIHFKYIFHCRAGLVLFPLYYNVTNPAIKFVDWLLSPLKWFTWRVIEMIYYAQLKLPLRVAPPINSVHKTPLTTAALVADQENHVRAVREGEIDMRVATISELKPGGAVLSNGDDVSIDLLLLATGFKSYFPMLDSSILSKLDFGNDGLWLYRQVLAPNVSGLAFVGSNCVSFMSPCTFALQALWLAHHLVNDSIPPSDEMEREKDLEKQFKQTHCPHCNQRGGEVVALMAHYHDVLVTEMGLDPMRSGGLLGPIRNYLLPVVPSTYDDLAD